MSVVRRSYRHSVVGTLAVLVALCATGHAQDYSSLSINDVYDCAKAYVQKLEYAKAVAPLQEVISRMAPRTDEQGRTTAQECRLELARVYYQMGQIQEGMALVEEYLDNDPRPAERMAMRMLAQAFFDGGSWDKIIEVAQRLKGMTGLEPDDMYNMNLLLGQAYYMKGMWPESIDPLMYAERNASDERVRGTCQIMVARALVESEQWNKLFSWVRRLENTDRRFDITLNLTFMRGAKGLYEEGGKENLLNALYLYRMVLPREKLVDYAMTRRTELQAEVDGASLQAYEVSDYKNEIETLDNAIKTVKELPRYEDEVMLRIGEIYGSVDIQRYWEAFVIFDRLSRESIEEQIREAGGYYAVKTLYDLAAYDRAEKRVLDYIAKSEKSGKEGPYQRELLLLMASSNLDRMNFAAVADGCKYSDALAPTDDPNKRSAKANLHYMQGLALMQNYLYVEACNQLSIIIDGMEKDGSLVEDYSDSPNWSYALFYRGMGYLLQGNYELAYDDFERYLKNYPDGELSQQAVFRMGVCQYGFGEEEDVESAEKTFTYFIDNYKSNPLLSEAYSLRGDIRVAKEYSGKGPHPLDLAQEDYDQAIKVAQQAAQARYPATRSAEAYKQESKWDAIIERMQTYMDLWGGQADIAEAQYWIGQAYIRRGQEGDLDAAFEGYINTIEKYGNKPDQLGVDKIIDEMVGLYKKQKSSSTKSVWMERVRLKLADAEKKKLKVLDLRWRVVQALLGGDKSVASLSGLLVDTVKDLTITSPSALYLMCDAAVESDNFEKMKFISDYFIENFGESDLIWHAYRARVLAQMNAKQYEEVLVSVDAVQGICGAAPELGWSQIAKANSLDVLNRNKEAEEAYKMISQVPQWRNEYMGEAFFGIGHNLFLQGEWEKAHSWFQRTYFQCKAFDHGTWAAKAYLGAADCLEKLERPEDAKNTLQALLDDKYIATEANAENVGEFIKEAGKRLGK